MIIAEASNRKNPVLRAYAVFVAISFYAIYITLLDLSPAQTLMGAARMCFVFPFAYLVAVYVHSDRDVHDLLRLFAVVIAVGALSLPLQTITGPISWFAESSTRAGLDRYSSLFGNLTAMGNVGGLALIVLCFIDVGRIVRIALIGCILVGMLLSLQKAAIINLVLVVPLYAVLAGHTLRERISLGARIIIIALVVATGVVVAIGPTALASVETVFRLGASAGAIDDYTVNASIVQRLVSLPMVLYDLYGPSSVLTGVGLKGGAGVFGFVDAPMSHNNFFDLLFVGGIAYLVSFAALLWYTLRGAWLARMNAIVHGDAVALRNLNAIFGVLVLFIINLPVASGTIFQPNISSIFWIAVGAIAGPYHRLPIPGALSRAKKR